MYLKKTAIVALAAMVTLLAGGLFVTANAGDKGKDMDKGVTDKLEKRFDKAREHFMDEEYDMAAKEVEKAADIVEMEAKDSSKDVKKRLNKRADELDAYAASLQKKGEKRVEDLEKQASKTYQEVANSRYVKASTSWAEEKYEQAAGELKEAGKSLDKATMWGREKAEVGYESAVKGARSAGNKVEKGADWTKKEVSDAMQALGNKISEYGKKLSDEDE